MPRVEVIAIGLLRFVGEDRPGLSLDGHVQVTIKGWGGDVAMVMSRAEWASLVALAPGGEWTKPEVNEVPGG